MKIYLDNKIQKNYDFMKFFCLRNTSIYSIKLKQNEEFIKIYLYIVFAKWKYAKRIKVTSPGYIFTIIVA